MSETQVLYGCVVDGTGIIFKTKQVVQSSGIKIVVKSAKGVPLKLGKGEKFHGDGVFYAVSFVDADKAKVQAWEKGVKAQRKLLRAAVTDGQ